MKYLWIIKSHDKLKTFSRVKVQKLLLYRVACTLFVSLILGVSFAYSLSSELTQAQAIARVKTILRSNTAGCRINKTNSVSAIKVKAGWRVTARIIMSASGSPSSETAVWIVSQGNGAVAQSQLASEIENGCP